MERSYYTINENIARVANDINSFREYKPGSATEEYKYYVDNVYSIVEAIQEKKPDQLEKALYMADRYSRKLATYYNDYYRNEAACPSVMVCGPANFPTRKKERQNSRRDTLNKVWNELEAYKQRIKNILTNTAPIKAGDADAIERLTDKISDLEAEKELMKRVNAFYRKHRTFEGIEEEIPEEFTPQMKRHIKYMLNFLGDYMQRTGHVFDTANSNQEIARLKDRLKKLQEVKEAGTTEEENELFTIIRNTEIMRLQLVFDGKPDQETRDILKHNGFKWAPSQNAWQRQLTDSAEYSLKRVIEALTA